MKPMDQVVADLQHALDRYAGWPVLKVDVRITDLRALLSAYADATTAERARCVAACRAVAERWARGELVGPLECAEACERGGVL